ncbi:hypothetical protein BDV40DRAFT_257076 [Aspergillus tamarii]|uniref:Uncharacterized protein n=1 Tax=Aspergillus tamarii TaxID=41984 RepID=A0A5N6V7L5_ASPTM|nr:hypothetical protein BDV40DRAFT_257076 [Aspergillus tamarii]
MRFSYLVFRFAVFLFAHCLIPNARVARSAIVPYIHICIVNLTCLIPYQQFFVFFCHILSSLPLIHFLSIFP